MNFYFAPLESITGHIYRNIYEKHFGGIDKYFTPFIASKKMNRRELNEILPEHNEGIDVVPQILTNRADEFLQITNKIAEYGYQTVNLNLGCPSPTVTTKGRGAAFLGRPEELREFFSQSFELIGKDTPDMIISVKTRLGTEDPDEIYDLVRLYNEFPICEVIIHARTLLEMYDGEAHAEVFASVLPESVGGQFQRALEARGIRCTTGSGEDLLKTEEREIAAKMLLQQRQEQVQELKFHYLHRLRRKCFLQWRSQENSEFRNPVLL